MSSANPLPVIKKSKAWMVINKPSGVSVHNEANDVVNLLKKQLPPDSYTDIHPVHRLDKETSGLLLIALEKTTAAALAEQFQARQSEKFYFAVLRGPMTVCEEWQEWSFPITDKAEGRKNPQGLAKDRIEAKSLYRVKKSNKFFSLVEVKLLTGRQHQIRKHAAIAKHAIVGDSRYGDPKYNEKMAKIYDTDRMFLHAFRLSIVIDGKTETFEAPLPEEFEKLLK